MNIFLKEMKAHRKSLMIWCAGMILLIASGMSKYAGLSSTGQSLNAMLEQIPKSIQVMMGMGTLDLSKATGYYGVLFLYIALMATIHAAMLGATIISKEERDKTAEFLFVKPVSRKSIILIKMLAALMNIGILTIISYGSSLLIVGGYSKGESVGADISVTIAGLFILQLIFLVTGTAIAAVYKKPKKAASLSAGVLLAMYLLSVAVDLNDGIKGLKYITPFKYFQASDMMYGGGLDTIYILLSAAIVVALFTLTIVFYKKRDLYL
ncbi:ABC transporter permease subunit [Paenibacillus harenae]|uniref:ABC transporter permease subunit n=1 Tax=Paenibacillus harenae TaxID=306543 RepID=UPI0003F950C4|nr:ABC transporter permease subunit [Paenibacillus harenae]